MVVSETVWQLSKHESPSLTDETCMQLCPPIYNYGHSKMKPAVGASCPASSYRNYFNFATKFHVVVLTKSTTKSCIFIGRASHERLPCGRPPTPGGGSSRRTCRRWAAPRSSPCPANHTAPEAELTSIFFVSMYV